ncbi:hypothetical protein PIB30_075494 [Stylosanthes scabra]|uniref:Uncharacterized protein n=1 Tax=Stylosanthes scabra TaxID=79078 RepID=A0ABU6XSJ8_9FABA|nr:hypothetical protein [Stylosanthes scabra]
MSSQLLSGLAPSRPREGRTILERDGGDPSQLTGLRGEYCGFGLALLDGPNLYGEGSFSFEESRRLRAKSFLTHDVSSRVGFLPATRQPLGMSPIMVPNE